MGLAAGALRPVTDDTDTLRRVFGCFPSGVAALCALDAGGNTPIGMAASSFTTVSLDPPLVSVCVQRTSTTWPGLRRRPRIGVSVLAEGHDEACLQLSRKDADRFAGVDWSASDEGSVLVGGATAWLETSLYDELPAGDHLIALLELHSMAADPSALPLVFHASAFRRLLATT